MTDIIENSASPFARSFIKAAGPKFLTEERDNEQTQSSESDSEKLSTFELNPTESLKTKITQALENGNPDRAFELIEAALKKAPTLEARDKVYQTALDAAFDSDDIEPDLLQSFANEICFNKDQPVIEPANDLALKLQARPQPPQVSVAMSPGFSAF